MKEDELKGAASKAHKWDRFSAWAIVGGLAAEVVVLLIFAGEHSPWETGLLVLATIIIALGVWGEIWFGRKAEEAGNELQMIANRRIADANENAARANERAAFLEREAENARARTAEIERITQWRRVSLEQTDIIVHEIRQKIPRNIVILIESVNDAEAIMFADQLRDLLINANAGGVERFARPMPADGKIEFGLYVSSEPEVYALIVRDAFQKAGIPITKLATAPGGPPRLTLYVGHKPR
jgi:hypothetical protein